MSNDNPASREDFEVLMVHMSLLAGWRVRTLGNALGSGVVVGLLATLVLGFAGEGEWMLAGPLIGVLVGAVALSRATAPVPGEEVD